jgi:hypothetical protein
MSLSSVSRLSLARSRSSSAAAVPDSSGRATTQPCSSTTDVPAVHSWPRSVPVRSQHNTLTRFIRAIAMAIITSPGRSPAGRGNSGQFVGTASRSAPASIRPRDSSGNSRSKQIRTPIRPMRVSTTGGAAEPGVKKSFSRSHRWVFR